MGCDIHAVFQARVDGKWCPIESTWEQDRHYFLFSWLADVRNGFGFAGVKTYEPVKPISEPRGLPADFTLPDDDEWLGDHSFSWLSADEILAAELPRTTRTGVVALATYKELDGKPPESWSGDIWGRDIHVADSPEAINEQTTHVRLTWNTDGHDLDYFVDEIRRLREQHGDVRMVFGFDS